MRASGHRDILVLLERSSTQQTGLGSLIADREPAGDEIFAIPRIEFFNWVKNGLADFEKRWPDSHTTPVAQRARADLAAIAFDNGKGE